MIAKVVRDGRVAVLVSPGFGAGWSSWNAHLPECLFWPEVVAWVEGGKQGPCPVPVEDFYDGGADDLKVEWVPVGAQFRISEYDGAESIQFNSGDYWTIA